MASLVPVLVPRFTANRSPRWVCGPASCQTIAVRTARRVRQRGVNNVRIHAGVRTVANRTLHAYTASGFGPCISHRPQFTHRVSLTTIKSALQFCTAVFVEMYVSGAAAQVIVPSVNVPTPATVED